MKKSHLDRIKTEKVYHDKIHRKGIVQKGHLTAENSSYYKFFYDLIGEVAGLTVLEVGCGSGWLGISLAKRGATVQGIDISGELISEAMQQIAQQGLCADIRFRKMAVEHLRFDNDFFALVIGSAILHHTDIRLAMTKIFWVLGPRGRAIFVEPLNENFALKVWRTLTPWRRSPTEKALLKSDVEFICSIFPHAKFHYFCFTSMVTTGLLMFLPGNRILTIINRSLERLDAVIARRFRFCCPYYAVAVMELRKGW